MKMNKRGQIISTISDTTLSIMVMIFLVFAVLFGVAALNPSGFFTAGSADANATGQLQANLTAGVATVGAYIPTAFKVLGVVLALGAIVLLIVVVRRMQGGGEGVGL